MRTAVETIGLTKTYRHIKAVDSLAISVPEGSIYGFLGPNGAGKTTTMKMLAGMSRPTSGEIMIFGSKVTFGSTRNRESIGFLPDVPGFYDWMDASEYLRFCGDLFSIKQPELTRKVDELLDTVGLKDTGKKKIGGFSRGMKQRLGIAQALVNDPRLIFLDEPVSALDPVGRKDVMDIISGLAGRVTVFFSTHVLEDVERVCDRVIIIKQGRAILEDTIENIKSIDPGREIEIEIEGSGREEILAVFSRTGWIDKIQADDDKKIRIAARDIKTAMKELPGIFYEKGIMLKRLNVIEPTLEDIFIKAVNDN
jgi:ABC-2 type transport system ATP-binding protein